MEYLEQDNGPRIEIPDAIVSQGRDAVAAFCAGQRPGTIAAAARISPVTPATPAAPAAPSAGSEE
jgi:hypothetical protein